MKKIGGFAETAVLQRWTGKSDAMKILFFRANVTNEKQPFVLMFIIS